MKRSASFEKNDLSLHHQAKGSVYSLMDHENHENINLPVNPNLLTYNDKILNKKLERSLFSNPGNVSPSLEFKNNLILFSIFHISYLSISIVITSLMYSVSNQSEGNFLLKITFLSILSCFSLLMLSALLRFRALLMKSRELISLLSIFMVFFMIVCDDRVLSGMNGEAGTSAGQHTILAIALYLAVVRYALMDSFKHLAIICITSVVISLIAIVVFSSTALLSGLADFFILLAFLVVMLMDTYQNDLRTKQLFWRKQKEKEYTSESQDELESDDLLTSIKTEVEVLIQSFDKIKKNIKSVCAVIMYKDVKNKLKFAVTEIERVKRRMAQGTFMNVVRLEQHPGISENDKLFIFENFTDPSQASAKRSTKLKQSRISEAPLWPSQGSELDMLLAGIGTVWDFDIWFVHQTTGHSVSLSAKYVMKKWTLAETLKIEESISDNYFMALERVNFT